jgi:hypothetical protein
MRSWYSLVAWVVGMLGVAVASSGVTAQDDAATIEKLAIVYSCETVNCSDPDGVKDPMAGATVTSFDAAGVVVGNCTTNEYGQCPILVPAAEDGTYTVTPGPGFEAHTLVSAVPESTGEGGDGREWTFVPAASPEEPADAVPVNVVACSDESCDDAVTMDGAELISYQDGAVLDRCTVSSAPDDFDGCQLVIDATSIDVEIIPPAGFEDHRLLSEEPEIYESEQHGRIHLWIYVLDVEETPEPDGETDETGNGEEEVSRLPRTGTGSRGDGETTTLVLSLAATIAAAALGVRLRGRTA